MHPLRREILQRNLTIRFLLSFEKRFMALHAFNERSEKTVLVFIVAHNFHSSTHNVEERNILK